MPLQRHNAGGAFGGLDSSSLASPPNAPPTLFAKAPKVRSCLSEAVYNGMYCMMRDLEGSVLTGSMQLYSRLIMLRKLHGDNWNMDA